MDDRYELHSRLQELVARADIGYRSFRQFHHVAYTTFYQFVKNPEIARDKTLTSVRLVCEFLSAALAARLLPIPREKKKEKHEIIDSLYNHWWNHNKQFVIKPEVEQELI